MALKFPPYAVLEAVPCEAPNKAPRDDSWKRPLLARKWWQQVSAIPLIDDFIAYDVVYTIAAFACQSGRALDATAVVMQEDPDTGLQTVTDVRYRGLAVLFLEDMTGLCVCANPASSDITYLPMDALTYIRIDPFTQDQEPDFG